jgi:hypothetical protein
VQGAQIDAYASDRVILVGLLIQANAADRFALAEGPIFGRWFGMLGKPSPALVVMFGVLSTPE